ncbi:hypothetical protein L7F22_020181 [Adiantum nelumboides]|nr:hypothetical protein [Adiantum nelumboides]
MSAVLALPQVKDFLKTLAKGKEKGQDQGNEHDVNAHAVNEEGEPSKKPWDEDIPELSLPSFFLLPHHLLLTPECVGRLGHARCALQAVFWWSSVLLTSRIINAAVRAFQFSGVDWTVDEDEIKAAYRRMVKIYHPDVCLLTKRCFCFEGRIIHSLACSFPVYDGIVELGEGETPETMFIKIQAAYELLVDKNERQQYDHDNQINPLKASKAWMEWILKKKKAFEQRGDMAVSAWAEQQQRELNLKARRLSKHKMDPEEERRILTREKQASAIQFESTLRRHTLVLKKRDLMRRKMDKSAQKQLMQNLLAAEGLELAEENEDD